MNNFFPTRSGQVVRMRIKFCNNKMWKVKSEEGFTLLELIMVTVITGTISSAIILPFASSMKQALLPEIYNTAAYVAMGELEKIKSTGYTGAVTVGIGTYAPVPPLTTKKGRDYNKSIKTEYVSYSDGSFSTSGTQTELIRATVTVSNTSITDISMSDILTDDFFN